MYVTERLSMKKKHKLRMNFEVTKIHKKLNAKEIIDTFIEELLMKRFLTFQSIKTHWEYLQIVKGSPITFK